MSAYVPPAVAVAALVRIRGLAALRQLATGLQADEEGAARLLERIAATDTPEELRALLAELGALAWLREGTDGTATGAP